MEIQKESVAKSYTVWLMAFSNKVKYLSISSYIRKPFLIKDFTTNPWIALYMRKLLFSFLSVYNLLWLWPLTCWLENRFLRLLLRSRVGRALLTPKLPPVAHVASAAILPSFLHGTENPIYVFLFWELLGINPNFHVHVSVSGLHISSSRIGRPIVWEYINCSQTHECGYWDWDPDIPFLGIFVSKFRYFVFAVYPCTVQTMFFYKFLGLIHVLFNGCLWLAFLPVIKF